MSAVWEAALREVLGEGLVVSDPDIVASYSRDQAPFAPAGTAAVLVRARNVEDVVRTLRFANERRIPVVTRAAGTGLSGAANAVDGCIVLSVAGMDKILGIDRGTRTAVVEPGVLNGSLAREVAELGLYYAPDPSSRDISTIGGNISTNAGGACCLKYGVTGDHVAGVKLVLADGTLVTTGAVTRKNVAGLDLTKLIVGSEGTLGVIVEATVRLLPAPGPTSTLVAFFDDMSRAVLAILAMDALPALSLIEVMDRTTIGAVDDLTHMQLDRTAGAMLLVQCDAPDAGKTIADAETLCRGARTVMSTTDVEEGRLLLQARRMALPALERLGATLLDDVAVPKPKLPEMMDRIQRSAERHRLVIGTFGHAGDGNLHPTIVFDGHDADSKARAFAAFDEIVRDAIALGGTITGEHGVGSLKREYLGAMVGEAELALMRRIKASFDPKGILNPGKSL